MCKNVTAAGCMLLLWLCVTLVFAAALPNWAGFAPAIACTLPMLLFSGKVRGATFGARDMNTVQYKKKDYFSWMLFTVSGSAILSALTCFAFGGESTSAGRNDFFYLLVFACVMPAFFEEYLVRGGVLGALCKAKGNGVWLTAALFALMHLRPTRMVYAFFAGICITTVVYLSENIYLGMLLHFLNNLTSLLLSYIRHGLPEYIALGVLCAVFVTSFAVLSRGKLWRDGMKLLGKCEKAAWRTLADPAILLFAGLAILIGVTQ